MLPLQYSMSPRCLRAAAAIETVGRVLPSIWARNSCEIVNLSDLARAAQRSSHDARRSSTSCLALQPAACLAVVSCA
jgi:hypothetical protein